MNAPIRSAIPARLQQLRQAMQAQGVHAVLVPSADPHLSEYLPEHWQGRQHFSGFTGSMGTLVVRLEDAFVFADSRYWTQAEAARRCGVTQPRINDLLRGRVSRFSLDALVNIATSLGFRVRVEIEAA